MTLLSDIVHKRERGERDLPNHNVPDHMSFILVGLPIRIQEKILASAGHTGSRWSQGIFTPTASDKGVHTLCVFSENRAIDQTLGAC